MTVSIGNRVTEKDLRDWLNQHGFIGRSAKVDELELYAIQRPGWVQVFRFAIRVRAELTSESDSESAQWLERVGVIRDDERQSDPTQVWIYDSTESQQQKLDEISEDLLVLRSGETGAGLLIVVGIFCVIVCLGLAITWLFN